MATQPLDPSRLSKRWERTIKEDWDGLPPYMMRVSWSHDGVCEVCRHHYQRNEDGTEVVYYFDTSAGEYITPLLDTDGR